jgi:hypothetical protein
MQHIDLNAAKAAKASDRKTLAILAYDNATASPGDANWRGVADLLRLALPNSKAKAETLETDSRYAPWADYPIPHNAGGKRLGKSPVCVVTFADGEVIRVPAVSLPGKAVNIGRALRVAVSFYHGRIVARVNDCMEAFEIGTNRVSVTDSEFTSRLPVPAVVSAICETTAAEYDPAACSALVSGLVPVAPTFQESPVTPSEYTDDDREAICAWVFKRLAIEAEILATTGERWTTAGRAARLTYAVMTLWPDLADSELSPVAPSYKVPLRFLASTSLVCAAA